MNGRTMGDSRDQVVSDVIVRDVVQEESPSPAEERSVNSSDGAPNKGPRILAEMGHRRVGVVQLKNRGYGISSGLLWESGREDLHK